MINEMIQRFKIHLEEDGKSVKTVESYVGDTTAFVAFLEEKGVDFTGEMKRFYFTSYRNYLINIEYNRIYVKKADIKDISFWLPKQDSNLHNACSRDRCLTDLAIGH